MKPKYGIIQSGDYFQLQTMEDSDIQQQEQTKKLQMQSSSSQVLYGKIETVLPSRDQIIKKFRDASTVERQNGNIGLDDYQICLGKLLKMGIKDQEKQQIIELLKEIEGIKKDGAVYPLNSLPRHNQQQQNYQPHESISMISQFNTEKLQQSLQTLQNIKYIELSRLQHLVQILLGNETKKQEQIKKPSTKIKDSIKDEIEKVYNNLSHLQCLNNLSGIVNRVFGNEIKYMEMNDWVNKIEEVNKINKDVYDELENDELMLKQLEENFRKNVERVKGIIQKLKK